MCASVFIPYTALNGGLNELQIAFVCREILTVSIYQTVILTRVGVVMTTSQHNSFTFADSACYLPLSFVLYIGGAISQVLSILYTSLYDNRIDCIPYIILSSKGVLL